MFNRRLNSAAQSHIGEFEMRKFFLTSAALLIFGGMAYAQNVYRGYVTASTATCCGGTVVYSSSGTCCVAVQPDEATLAAWAAKKAVAAQLDWYDEKKVEKLERADLDALQARVDALCKWAKTLSNHIFATAYADWSSNATSKIEERRKTLDKIDVAKSLVTGLPTPPEVKP